VTLSVTDTLHYFGGLYLSADRFFLPLPLGIWAVCAFTLSARHQERREPQMRRNDLMITMAVVVVGCASFVSAQIQFSSVTKKIEAVDASPASYLEVVNPAALVKYCDSVDVTYHETQAQWFVAKLPDFAYGCAAETGMNTFVEIYDRRGWLFVPIATDPVTRILVQESSCNHRIETMGRCITEPDQTLLLITPPRPLGVTLAKAGLLQFLLPDSAP